MPFQKYTVATGALGEGRNNLPFPVGAGEAVLEVIAYADPKLKKVVAGAIVDKSAGEITTEADADKDAQTIRDFDGGLVLRAAVTYMLQQINVVRQDPTTILPPITANAARTAILAIYKGLL